MSSLVDAVTAADDPTRYGQKMEVVKRRLNEIKECREQGFSWRAISDAIFSEEGVDINERMLSDYTRRQDRTVQ